MSMDLGYLTGTLIFAVIFIAAVIVQIKSTRFNPYIYWFTVIATTTVGTTLADFALSRYVASLTLMLFIVVCILLLPQRSAQRDTA